MAWEARSGLKRCCGCCFRQEQLLWLNGLGSPFGIETSQQDDSLSAIFGAKWPGKPVRD